MLSNIEAEAEPFFSDFGQTIALPTITHVKENAADNEDTNANENDKLKTIQEKCNNILTLNRRSASITSSISSIISDSAIT